MTASCQVLVLFSLLTFVHAAGNSANIAVAFLLQGINSTSPEAQAANVSMLLQGDPTPAAFYHLPNGVRALFQAAVQSAGVTIHVVTGGVA
ncbi:hypothetical protein WJX82_002998 [Trebouxia sp. C0006]